METYKKPVIAIKSGESQIISISVIRLSIPKRELQKENSLTPRKNFNK